MSGPVASPFRQPKAVYAVAFACVVSFMGIGLVDPILPAISHELHASPSEVTLLFTSYLVVTAVAMLITNWVSSRIGAKKTLIAGLILIVTFSALAGASPTVSQIIGFRAGWGVGNALFIATSLAVIVASASGGFAGAIVLYETALGAGIAVGPLLGGTLGEISWRGPFYGVACLMAIALIATVVLVEPTPKPARTTGLSAPLRALRHRGLLTMSLTALCYNWGFFTVLGYAPFPMNLSPIRLGLVFTGWGILVALFAVFGAPRLQASLGIARTMYLNLAAFAVIVLVIAIWTTDRAVLIPAVIASGIFIGVNNTITTQAVMTVSPVEKPVASAAYSFVRFIGGGLAPYAAGRLVLAVNIHLPFFIGAGAILAGIGILSTAHGLLGDAERAQAGQAVAEDPELAVALAEELATSLPGVEDGGMRYLSIALDTRISRIGLGTWQFGSREWGYGESYAGEQARAIVRRALELGVTLFDTAEIYGFGRSERILGEALGEDRESVFIATKILPVLPIAPVVEQRAVASARRLQARRLDLYQVHQPNPVVRDGTIMRGMRTLQQVGLVGEVGVSNYSLDRWRAAERALGSRVLSNQVRYSLVTRAPQRDLVPYAESAGRVVIAYSPLEQGLLSGRYHRGSRPANRVRAGNPLFLPENLERAAYLIDVLREVADAHGATPAQVALAWVIRSPAVVAIPGASSVEQLESNVAAASIELTDDQAQALSAAADRFRPVTGPAALPGLVRARFAPGK